MARPAERAHPSTPVFHETVAHLRTDRDCDDVVDQ